MKSTKDLRDFLVDQMHSAANGELDLARCKGVSNLAQQIYNTLNIEVKFAQAREKGVDIQTVEFTDERIAA